MPIDNKVNEAIKLSVNELGYELVEVSYRRESKENYLHIVIDKDDVINLDDIVLVSDKVSELLDELDPIKENYILDVSSLGAEKPIVLDKLANYVNKYVNLHLSNPYKGDNTLEGTLKSVDDENVILEIKIKTRVKEITLIKKDIDKARLAIKF